MRFEYHGQRGYSRDEEVDDLATVRLRNLGGMRPIPEWIEITWADCVDCGSPLYGPGDEDEKIYDGEPLVCVDCGCVHGMSADPDGWAILARTDVDDSWTHLDGVEHRAFPETT